MHHIPTLPLRPQGVELQRGAVWCGGRTDTQGSQTAIVLYFGKWLGELIGSLIRGGNVVELNGALGHLLPNVVISHIDML